MIKIQLSNEQRKELELFRRHASAKDSEKALMVLMSSDGETVKQIARTLRRNPHTVRDWLKRYHARGLAGLARKFSPGRPDDKRIQLIKCIAIIISDPPASYGYQDAAWTVPLIAYHVNSKIGLNVSRDTIVRALKSMGYSYKRPSKTVPGTAPSAEEKRLAVSQIAKQINDLIKKKDCVVYALDESHFSTEPYLVQGWFKKRWPPQDSNEQKKKKSHVFWMLEFDDTNIHLFSLPTYSPEYNPVELFWKWIKPKVYGFSAVGGIEELVSRFRKIVWHYNNNRIPNRIKFNLKAYDCFL